MKSPNGQSLALGGRQAHRFMETRGRSSEEAQRILDYLRLMKAIMVPILVL
jgi:hypothetical protein